MRKARTIALGGRASEVLRAGFRVSLDESRCPLFCERVGEAEAIGARERGGGSLWRSKLIELEAAEGERDDRSARVRWVIGQEALEGALGLAVVAGEAGGVGRIEEGAGR